MRPLITEAGTAHTPESLVEQLRGGPGVVLLRTSAFESPAARYSFVTARPFLTFRSLGSRCEISPGPETPDPSPEPRASATIWQSLAHPGQPDGALRNAGGN